MIGAVANRRHDLQLSGKLSGWIRGQRFAHALVNGTVETDFHIAGIKKCHVAKAVKSPVQRFAMPAGQAGHATVGGGGVGRIFRAAIHHHHEAMPSS